MDLVDEKRADVGEVLNVLVDLEAVYRFESERSEHTAANKGSCVLDAHLEVQTALSCRSQPGVSTTLSKKGIRFRKMHSEATLRLSARHLVSDKMNDASGPLLAESICASLAALTVIQRSSSGDTVTRHDRGFLGAEEYIFFGNFLVKSRVAT